MPGQAARAVPFYGHEVAESTGAEGADGADVRSHFGAGHSCPQSPAVCSEHLPPLRTQRSPWAHSLGPASHHGVL